MKIPKNLWLLHSILDPCTNLHSLEGSFLGKPIASGCQSHYVCTNKAGHVQTNLSDETYDEIVIGQESQILPSYVLTVDLNPKAMKRKILEFERDLPGSEKKKKKRRRKKSSSSIEMDSI